MNEVIARINSLVDYVDIAIKDDHGEAMFKKIAKEEYVKIVNETLKDNSAFVKKNIKLLNQQIIAINEHFAVVRQEGSKKIVTYSINGEAYKINFPNAIYIIEISGAKIRGIECYAYKEYKGEETELYEYPMPNELSGNHMCIGNADRSIKDNDIVGALEKIIFTPYSHTTFSGMNGFSNTQKYFEYLEKNEFPYKLMKSLRKKLGDVLHG